MSHTDLFIFRFEGMMTGKLTPPSIRVPGAPKGKKREGGLKPGGGVVGEPPREGPIRPEASTATHTLPPTHPSPKLPFSTPLGDVIPGRRHRGGCSSSSTLFHEPGLLGV